MSEQPSLSSCPLPPLQEPVEDPQDPQAAEEEELSELQRLTQELTSLNTSLARLEAAQPLDAPVEPAPVEPAPAEPPEPPGREMATLLTTLDDLNRSLGQLDPQQQQQQQQVNVLEKVAGDEMQIQQMQPKTGSPSGSYHGARQPQAAQAAQAEKAHHLEQVFPQQAPRVPHPAAHPAHPGAIGAIGAIDPGRRWGDVGRSWAVHPRIFGFCQCYIHIDSSIIFEYNSVMHLKPTKRLLQTSPDILRYVRNYSLWVVTSCLGHQYSSLHTPLVKGPCWIAGAES